MSELNEIVSHGEAKERRQELAGIKVLGTTPQPRARNAHLPHTLCRELCRQAHGGGFDSEKLVGLNPTSRHLKIHMP